MAINSDHRHRQSTRLRDFDYTQPGAYFVTICTQERACVFEDDQLRMIAERGWLALARHNPSITLDTWVVMPNHLHGVIVIVDDAPHSKEIVPSGAKAARTSPLPINVAPRSLGAIVRSYKSVVTRMVNVVRRTPGAPVWQRNYHEHVVRDDVDLERVRQYIIENPTRWEEDRDNLDALLKRMVDVP